MPADPNQPIAEPALGYQSRAHIEQLLQSSLADLSLRGLLRTLPARIGAAEREANVEPRPEDTAALFHGTNEGFELVRHDPDLVEAILNRIVTLDECFLCTRHLNRPLIVACIWLVQCCAAMIDKSKKLQCDGNSRDESGLRPKR